MFKSTYFYVLLFLFSGLTYAQEDHKGTITNYLSENAKGLSPEDFSDFEIYSETFSEKTKTHHVYAVQKANGIPIFNAMGNFAIKNEKVTYFANNFIPNINDKTNTSSPSLTALQSVQAAASKLGLTVTTLDVVQTNGNNVLVSKGNISLEDIPVKLVYQPIGGELKLAWDMSIHMVEQNHWWSIRVDAITGEIIHQNDWVVSCNYDHDNVHSTLLTERKNNINGFGFKSQTTSLLNDGSSYNVFPLPVESPASGSRSIVSEPANLNASPFGWHDANGATGPEYTGTRGNNVWAFENRDGNNFPGQVPEGGSGLDFDFPLNLAQDPDGYINASVTNLFFWNNLMHDVWYEYGFDEQSGNFQETHYIANGAGQGDFVVARGQDGADNGPGNNATFGTPPDSQSGVMRMFTWTASNQPPNILSINSSSAQGTYAGTQAQFGPDIPTNGITQDLVLVIDNNATTDDETDACDPITNAGAISGKIAVIRRGECEFVFKVQSAQDAGAVGVIIVNNVPNEQITMSGTSFTINIPSIAVTLSVGESIIDALENGENVNGTILNPVGPFIRDGSLDGSVVSHEYGHGISNRLTGGRINTSCLYACQEVDNDGNCIQFTEQMGEGWSDFFALIMTMQPGDVAEDPRAIAPYSSGNPGGLRSAPYTTDFSINGFTYGNTNNTFQLSAPHGVGFVWATMLWDLTWAMIDKHGFDSDIYNGTGGNNMAMQLVMDGLKLQSCNPGFVDGRDAILQADMQNNNGDNQCLIWNVFAARGLGFSATQGSSLSRTDQVESFDTPPQNVLDCSLGTSSREFKNFTIYPNPAGDIVNIQTRNNSNNITVEVFDINGRKVISKAVNNNSLDVSKLSQGIYIIKMSSNELTQTEKLIIK